MIHLERGVLTKDFCEYLSLNTDMMMNFLGHPRDKDIANSTGYYSPIFFESLMVKIQQLVEVKVGKKLYPCYSYGRIYYENSMLPKHRDRPPGEYGVTICIEKDIDWPIHFEIDGEVKSYELEPGDICIYKGIEYMHWREKYTGKKHTQCFLVYVDANGPYSEWKYDKRPALCMPGR